MLGAAPPILIKHLTKPLENRFLTICSSFAHTVALSLNTDLPLADFVLFSIQTGASCILYYTYFYVFIIIPYFVLCYPAHGTCTLAASLGLTRANPKLIHPSCAAQVRWPPRRRRTCWRDGDAVTGLQAAPMD